MVIFHFGADKPAEELKTFGFKRRNTILLKHISESSSVTQVVNFNHVDRPRFFRNFFRNYAKPLEKVKDVFFSELFVIGRFKIHFLNRLFNKIYFQPLKNRYARQGTRAWIYWPNGYYDYKVTGLKLEFIFDADHNLVDDPNLVREHKDELLRMLEEISVTSKLIVCASKSMLAWFRKKGANQVHRLRNGIDLNRFNRNGQSQSKRFSVVYCGMLSRWINYDLFVDLVKDNPDIDFIIIGAAYATDSYEYLRKFANVAFLGEKSSDEVARLLPTFNVGLALYKSDVLLDGDSMKIYEYMAAGLPVVCTNYHDSLKEDFENLLLVGDSRMEINQLLQSIRNKSIGVDENAVNSFLNRSTWDKRVNEVLNKINGK